MCEVGAMVQIRRLALVSDVHGNVVALDAVLTDLSDQAPVDEIWALGDLVAIGPDEVTRVATGGANRRCLRSAPSVGSCHEVTQNHTPNRSW